MKFKCILSGCVYDFTSDLDIKSMRQSPDYVEVGGTVVKPPVSLTTIVPVSPVVPGPDYVEVGETAAVPPPEAPVSLATIVPVPPVVPGPNKPLPTAVKAPKAV